MRQHIQSELPQIGHVSQLPGSVTSPVSQSKDTATLDLLSAWQKQDATADPEQLQAAEKDLAAFMKILNKTRAASGEPLVYP